MEEKYSFERAQNEAQIIKEKAEKIKIVRGESSEPDAADYLKSQQQLSSAESLSGLNKDTSFEETLSQEMHYDISPEKRMGRTALFKEHGIHIDPCCVDGFFDFSRFEERDWENIRNSAIPMTTLLAANTYHELVDYFSDLEQLGAYSRKRDTSLQTEVLLRSLPLVHGTSVNAFLRIAESGKLVSNKTIFKNGELDIFSFQASNQGMTLSEDRRLGLDQYVFADFARPHMYHEQQEITLVIAPSVMQAPGVFMTEKDIADCTLAKNRIEEYARGIATPEYFYEIAKMRIKNTRITEGYNRGRGGSYSGQTTYNTVREFIAGVDGDKDQLGQPNFSTWEIKLPEVPVSAIKRVIVRNKEQFDSLSNTYSGQFDFIYEPELKPGHYESLIIPGEYERLYSDAVDQDYAKRVEALDALSVDEKEVVFAVFVDNEVHTASIQRKITDKTNPFLHPAEIRFYDRFDDIADTIKAPHNYSDGWGSSEWYRDCISGEIKSNISTVCTIERSKANHKIVRIVRMQEITPSEFI
jgi:hypothetical protein